MAAHRNSRAVERNPEKPSSERQERPYSPTRGSSALLPCDTSCALPKRTDITTAILEKEGHILVARRIVRCLLKSCVSLYFCCSRALSASHRLLPPSAEV